ncbi:hypothetical protein CBR_g30816 [Chara braunii]|uniref:Myb-like domain-containing protein n=1 Tax=Chara braunii TaxID=69332 RepID=A0A388JXJ8_CHABU|nr:hypothetical protein CBR_g30816 [Chara braunii]|eukprot:GBG62497.1 hypothetical protein CBR_g30816 [Chara braunii]
MEPVDDDDDVEIRPLGKTTGRGKGRLRGGGCGRSGGRGGRGGASDDGGKSVTYWSTDDQLRLVRCKREQDMHLAGLGHYYGWMRTEEWKWDDIAKRMANMGTSKEVDDCSRKWDNLFQNYKKIQRFQGKSGEADFFRLANKEREEDNFKFRMERVLYNEIHASMLVNHTIFPPNIADTGSLEVVQLPRRGVGGGESVGSEAGGDGSADDRSSARDSGQNAGSGAGGGKRKNARQQTFEAITEVMDRHGQLMASTIDSLSKRQCSILTRQCDILEQEVAVQRAHYAASDETYKMMCHAHMEIVAAIRGRKAMSPRGGGGSRARGKKLDAPHDDVGGADRGVRHVMKAKKDRRDGASFSGPRTDGDGWGRPNETDDNDVFSMGAPDDQPPPLPSNIHAIAGGSSAQVTTRDERIINVEVNEDTRLDEGQGGVVPERSAIYPLTLSTTPRQQRALVATGGAVPKQAVPLPATPRQHRAGDNVGSGVAATTATAVEPLQPRHAGADVGVVAGAPWGAMGEGRRGEDVASATEVARAEKKRGGEDDEPLVNRVRKGGLAKDLAERARLWVDDKSFWTSREGRILYNIINETREHLVTIASGLPLPNVLRSVAMPRSNIAQIRVTDAGQLQGALSRASKVQSLALRVLHGWVFKSGSRERGYNVAFQYVVESVATDIAHSLWHGEKWSNAVSPAVCAHTLDMGMDLPLWFVGVHIEDRPANDEMAAYQEATVMQLIAAFSTAVETAQNVDGGHVAHKRLSCLAESFKELLAACMWIIELHHYDDHDDDDDDYDDYDDDDNDDDDDHGDNDDDDHHDDELAMWEKLRKALHGARHWL